MGNIEQDIQIKLRVQLGKGKYFGPGKISLLEAINSAGSISSAAKSIGMSYRKAWKLVSDINKLSKNKIVITNTGGKGIGGAYITTNGSQLIKIYREMEKKTLNNIKKERLKLSKILEYKV